MKYIIDIPDNVKKIVYFHVGNANAVWTTSNVLDDLELLTTDYINEHYGSLQDEAYQRGLDDAWECARKISLMPPDEIEKVFPGAAKYNRYNLGYSGVEAIEKLKAYEEKQKVADKIEVGDEVTAFNELTEEVEHFVVIEVGGYFGKGNVGLFALYGNNKSSVDFKAGCFSISAKDVTKTGRHFDIDKILEEMRHD
jgi:hypothetical protein